MTDDLYDDFNEEAAKPFKIVVFKDTQAPFMQGSESAQQSAKNHLKQRLGLEDADFTGGTIWTDKFGNDDYSYEFAVTVEAGEKLSQQNLPNVKVKIPGLEPSFRFSAPAPKGGFGFAS